MEYDWRTRFGMGLSDVGRLMSWGEALRLVGVLRRDTTSQFAASCEQWEFPISREAAILLDHFDLDMQVAAGKKAKPHPGRPWKVDQSTKKRHGDAGGRSRAEVIAILNAHGHQLPV